MSILDLDHVQVAMPAGREEAARAFYCGVLGKPELPKLATLASRGSTWFAAGSRQLHLGVEADFRPARKAHPAFLVQDLTALLKRCCAAGIEVVDDDHLPGFMRAYVNDPFGNRIESLQRRQGVSE